MTIPINLDHEIRVARLEHVIEKQCELLDMAVDWGDVWQNESSAPENNRLPDFYLKLSECIAILKVQLRYELEIHKESTEINKLLQ